MPEKNKSAKRRTSRVGGVRDVAGTRTRKAVIKQAKAKAKELCKPGYPLVCHRLPQR
jgi:hypothetical protein